MTKDLISRVADELTAEQYSVTNPIGVRPMAVDFYIYASVAQQVERWPEEPSVTSSILVRGTIDTGH